MHYPQTLLKLVTLLKKIPGVGTKSAERFAFKMIEWDDSLLEDMAQTIANLKKEIYFCSVCGCMIEQASCSFCDPEKRDASRLCIVGSFKDVFLIEDMREYKGLYQVLGGILSPLHGKEIAPQKITLLRKRIAENGVKEVIIAIDSTLEGEATSLYIKEQLSDNAGLAISRLALGIPMGASLDYIDQGTLAFAFSGRSKY
jgi:recombination protein RecR